MKKKHLIIAVFVCLFAFLAQPVQATECTIWSKSCSQSCIWLIRDKWAQYSPAKKELPCTRKEDCLEATGTCATRYDMDILLSCTDAVEEVGKRCNPSCT